MTRCGFVFEWDDKHKVPLDHIITHALRCKSDLVYRLDFSDDIPKAVVGARNYDEAVEAVIEREIDSPDYLYPMEPWETADQSLEERISTGKINFDKLINDIKEALTLWEPPYKHLTEGYQKSHTCPKCGHEFKEKKFFYL